MTRKKMDPRLVKAQEKKEALLRAFDRWLIRLFRAATTLKDIRRSIKTTLAYIKRVQGEAEGNGRATP